MAQTWSILDLRSSSMAILWVSLCPSFWFWKARVFTWKKIIVAMMHHNTLPITYIAGKQHVKICLPWQIKSNFTSSSSRLAMGPNWMGSNTILFLDAGPSEVPPPEDEPWDAEGVPGGSPVALRFIFSEVSLLIKLGQLFNFGLSFCFAFPPQQQTSEAVSADGRVCFILKNGVTWFTSFLYL